MLKYAKIIDKETGLCSVGISTNEKIYQSFGMTQLDVKQSDIDGEWYLTKKCPMKTDEEKVKEENTKRIDKIKAELEEIDRQGQRSARAIALVLAGLTLQPANTLSANKNALTADTPKNEPPTFNPNDLEKLSELEKRAEALRAELHELFDEEIPF